MICLALIAPSFGVGILAGAAMLYRMRDRRGGKRAPEGFAGSDDFSWPGRPMRIIDAETAARHVGGGE